LAKANGNAMQRQWQCNAMQTFIIFADLMKIIEQYSRKKLVRQAKAIRRRVVLCPPGEAKKVGILWHENDQKAFNYLQDFFRQGSAIVRYLCFSEVKQSADSNILTRKETNWLGWPRSGVVETFIHTEFDLLMNVTTSPCYPLEVITALSRATFRIGWDINQSGFYDLSVDVSSNPDALYLAEQQIFYLQRFNKKT